MKRWLILPLLIMLLGGCATRTLPPVTSYRLQSEPIANPGHREIARTTTLKLAPIRGLRPFSTTAMLYTSNGLDQKSFAFSRWSDSPTAMLQLLLTEALNRSGLFHSALPPSTTQRSDLTLVGTLHDFSLHLEEEEGARGVIEIRFLLLDNRKRKVLGSRFFSARTGVDDVSPESTAQALSRASHRIFQDLKGWLEGFDSFRNH